MEYNDTIIFKTSKEDKQQLQQEANKLRVNLSSLIRYKLFSDGTI